jgi:hypothetical protein
VTAVAAVFSPVATILAKVADVFARITHVLTGIAPVFDAVAAAAIVLRVAHVFARIAHVFPDIAPVLPAVPPVFAVVAHVLAPIGAPAVPVGAGLRHQRRGRHQRQHQSLKQHSSSHRFTPVAAEALGDRHQLGREGCAPRCFAILHGSRGRLQAALLGGSMSDRYRRAAIFVIAGAALMALAEENEAALLRFEPVAAPASVPSK